MPEFANPFPGNVPRQITASELERAIMLDIAAELEAVHLYLAQMDATPHEDARKVLYDIALEELVHAGEFSSLLYRLNPVTGAKAREGFEEVRELLHGKAPYEVESTDAPAETAEEPPVAPVLTVGSLKDA